MSEPITAQISDRICNHMNKDHADAVLTYAQVYGQTPAATAATMKAIDALGMDLEAQVDGQPTAVRVVFDHPLADAKAAHHVLVEMLKQIPETNPETTA
jgi:putative heme iron utilization protein